MTRIYKFMCVTRYCTQDAAPGHAVCRKHLITDVTVTAVVGFAVVAAIIGATLGAFR